MNTKIHHRRSLRGLIAIHRRLCLVCALGAALFASALHVGETVIVGTPKRPTDEATIRKLEEERQETKIPAPVGPPTPVSTR